MPAAILDRRLWGQGVPSGAMTVGDVDSSWRTSRLVTINDVYTFEKASGHGGFAAASTLINELRRGHQGGTRPQTRTLLCLAMPQPVCSA